MAQTNTVSGVATNISQQGDDTVVTYHQTDVVRFNGQSITLKTGGWFTVTTKARMNQASNQFGLGYQVFQARGQWFVRYQGRTHAWGDHQCIRLYVGGGGCDGMTADGRQVLAPIPGK